MSAANYNLFAGRGLERLGALSDGLFAIAMTIIILEVHVPEVAHVRSEADLISALTALEPRLLTYVLSFLTLGIFWVGQQAQTHHLVRGDRHYTWLSLLFLSGISFLPFSTGLLAEFTTMRTALLVYWLNILFLGLTLLAAWLYAERAGLVKPETPKEVSHAIKRRIIVAQSLYAAGAALALIDPYWAILAIGAVQLNYAVAPNVPLLRNL